MEASPFNRSCYTVDIRFSHFLKGISMYTHGDLGDLRSEGGFTLDQDPSRMFECVPQFQRDNDKWSREMQISFIENVIRGFKTTLMFYEVGKSSIEALRMKSFVIDGLQRLTAIYAFITGEFEVFGYGYDEFVANKVSPFLTVKFAHYTFGTEIEAVEFYISINENMTHSPNDIQRAKTYLNYLKKLNHKKEII